MAIQRTQKKRHFIRPRKRTWHFRWPKAFEVEAKAQTKKDTEEEVMGAGRQGLTQLYSMERA